MKRKTKTTITPKHTIRTYIQQQMECNQHSMWGLASFEAFLGRAAMLQDLNDRVLSAYFDWLAESAGCSAATRASRKSYILQIARDAADRGIIKWPAPDWNPECSWAPVPSDPGGIGSLRYFEEVFLPARPDLKPSTVKTYRRSIQGYERFVGPGARTRICRVSRTTLRKYREWLIANGMHKRRAANHAHAVALVAKHANPERFVVVDTPAPNSKSERALAYVFETMYLPVKPAIASPRTEHMYRMTFVAFGRYLGRVPTLDDLTDANVGAFMRHLKAAGKAAETINGYRAKLRAIWEWAARTKLVDKFPTIGEIPVPARLPSAWTEEQLVALFGACGKMPGYVADVLASDWWRAIHLISWDTGERTGALFQLRWDMLDMKTRKLIVPAEFRKGGMKPMPYTLKADTMMMLQRIRPFTSELILPFDRTRGVFYARYKKLLKLAGLPYVPWKSSLQKMRRSFATHIEIAGGNATSALAHTSRLLTERSYLDPVLLDTTPANELLFSLT